MKNKTYVSGKITGLSKEECEFNFSQGTLEAQEFSKEVLNIYEVVPFVKGKTWKQYMSEDVLYLFECDSIYMLSNWGDSKGARLERAIAIEMGLDIIYQSEYKNK